MSWLVESLSIATMMAVALWFVPGWVVLRVAGMRGLTPWALAPAALTLSVGFATTVLPQLGLPWTRATAVALWLLTILVVGITRLIAQRVARRTRPVGIAADSVVGGRATSAPSSSVLPKSMLSQAAPPQAGRSQAAPRQAAPPLRQFSALRPSIVRWTVLAGVTSGLLVMLGVVLAMPDAAAPLQVRDAFVHINAIAAIRDTAEASMFGGLDAVVARPGAVAFYPSAWHAVASLLPQSAVGIAANATMLAVMIAVWPVAMAYLTRAAFPGSQRLVAIVVALSAALSFFPFTQTVLSAQWPNALGTALLPVALGALLWCMREPRRIGNWAILALAAAGAVIAHPNTAFSLLALAAAVIVGATWRAGRTWRQRRSVASQASAPTSTGPNERGSARAKSVRRFLPWLLAGSALFAAIGAVVVSPLWPLLLAVMRYEQTIATRSYPFTVGRLLSDTALWQVPGNVIVSIAVLIGVTVLLRRRSSRWLVATWGITIVLAALAGGPENTLRGITGFWYKHVFRLEALYPITALILAAVGISAFAQWIVRRQQARIARAGIAQTRMGEVTADLSGKDSLRAYDDVQHDVSEGRIVRLSAAVTAAALILVAVCQVPGMVIRSRGVYDPAALAARGALVVDTDDRRMLELVHDLVPPGAVVIADPGSGGVLLSSYGGVKAVFQRTNVQGVSPQAAYLAQEFSSLAIEPGVCAALRDLDVTYAYLDTDLQSGGTRADQAAPGFVDMDVHESGGFELVATEGSVSLYRITACSQ